MVHGVEVLREWCDPNLAVLAPDGPSTLALPAVFMALRAGSTGNLRALARECAESGRVLRNKADVNLICPMVVVFPEVGACLVLVRPIFCAISATRSHGLARELVAMGADLSLPVLDELEEEDWGRLKPTLPPVSTPLLLCAWRNFEELFIFLLQKNAPCKVARRTICASHLPWKDAYLGHIDKS